MQGTRTLDSVVTVSSAMNEALAAARSLARSSRSVFVHGETGVGKKLLARIIHEEGPHGMRPLVTLRCDMLTVEILDRVLFGDRWSNVPGKIEEAEGGTLLLTEVEDLTPVAQERLAKVLTDGRYTTACGDTRILSCRIIATGNRAVVEKAVRTGAFSSELFSMLSQETIRMPSLDERREDIPELAMTILRGLADRERIDVPSVPYHYLELLTHVAYSENVRQLRNHIESVMVLSGGEFDPAIIREHFIPETSTGTLKGALQALWSKFQSGAAEPVLTRR